MLHLCETKSIQTSKHLQKASNGCNVSELDMIVTTVIDFNKTLVLLS